MHQRSELLALLAMLLITGGAAARRLLPGAPAALLVAVGALGVAIAIASIVLWRREQAQDAATRAISRLYLREFMPAMLGYSAAVLLSVWLLQRVEATALRALIAVLPLLPVALSLRATARYIRGLDEMHRRIELEALALGSIGVAFVYLTGGFLQAARVIDVSGATTMLWVLPSLCLAYAVAKRFVARHYA